MDAIAYLPRQIAAVRRIIAQVVTDLTEDQINWAPPGTANTIGAIYLHIFTSQDSMIHAVIQGKPRLWETQDWSAKTEIAIPPSRGHWEGVIGKWIALAPVQAYQVAVSAAVDAYLATLTDEELGRSVNFAGGEQPVADVLATLVVHASMHAGEIATLKGIQGLKGLPM